MLNAGLTGGIAGGKSTVSDCFREKGAYIIDFDLLTRQVQAPGEATWQAIVNHFGTGILNPDRTINRELLAGIVFSDARELQVLNGIVHPAVNAEWKRQIARIEQEQPDAIIISEIPLLIEVGFSSELDVIILVYISREEQINRLILRNRLSLEDAQKRIASQMPIEEKRKYADFIIDNTGTVEEAKKAVDSVWPKLVELEIRKRNS